MKSLLLILFCFAATVCSAQKLNLLPRLTFNTGIAEQKGRFRNAYGIGAGAEMKVFQNGGLKLFSSLDLAINGKDSEPYTLSYRNTITKTRIHYMNLAFQFNSGLRYIFHEQKPVAPYAGIGAGWFMYHMQSHINDPDDPSGCGPVESNIMQADKSFYIRLESGVRLASKWRTGNGRPINFDIGLALLRGTTADYVRMGSSSAGGSSAKVYSAKFSTPDNEIHEHAIGTIYRTPLRQLMFHVGGVIPIGGSSSNRQSLQSRRVQERAFSIGF